MNEIADSSLAQKKKRHMYNIFHKLAKIIVSSYTVKEKEEKKEKKEEDEKEKDRKKEEEDKDKHK
jgi:hypothetical protein